MTILLNILLAIIILAALLIIAVSSFAYLVHCKMSDGCREMRKDRIRTRTLLTFLVGAGFVLANCGKPPEPAAPARPPTVPRVLLVGGLETSQFTNKSPNVAEMVAGISEVQMADFGTPNGYKADIAGYVLKYPNDCDIGIGHSMGCGAMCRAAAAGAKFRKFIFLDPAGDTDIIIPVGVDCVVFVAAPTPFITQSHVIGLYKEIRVPEMHNDFLHVPENLALIEAEIRGAL